MPSRFLKDIDSHYLIQPEKLLDSTLFVPKKETGSDLTSYPSAWDSKRTIQPIPRLKRIETSENVPSEQVTSLGGFTVGDKVRHDRFGKGEIISLEGSGGNAKTIIEFEHLGQKTLFLKYAVLTILNSPFEGGRGM
jgi:DNA helicase-2/ATP-dependent DNA helicase PcrA